jgi:leucine dehydrogenase
MQLFDHPEFDDHEHVSFFRDVPSGLRAVIAIHSTAPMGIAGGGCRMLPYASDEEAVRDALRLSRAMSYKLALFDMPAGGAKAVVVADPRRDKNEALLLAIGRAVGRLGGRFIIAEDVGTDAADMEVIAKATHYVVRRRGDTTFATGYGVFVGLRAAVRRLLGRELDGMSVAVQGAGNVGYHLARRLAGAGARVFVGDPDDGAALRAVRELGAERIGADAIYDAAVDVLCPCALGAVLNDATIPRLRCRLVAGGANNQLAEDRHAAALAARGIHYIPDFVLNAGGVLGASAEVADFVAGAAERGEPFDEDKVLADVGRIAGVVERVLERAEAAAVTPHAAAVDMAHERIRAARA